MFPAVFEKVLLIPSAELGAGDLRHAGLPISADDGHLMAVCDELTDFPHPEFVVLAAADERAAFGQEHVGVTAGHEGYLVGAELA